MPEPSRDALLIDYGGVLTTSVTRSFRAFCTELGLPSELAKEAFVEAYSGPAGNGPVHRMETGEITVEEFAAGMAQLLSERSGIAVPADGLIARLFALMQLDEEMLTAVAAAKRAGIRTALLSNSWGSEGYPRDRFPELFDVVVISGEVGIRKPDPAIFDLTVERLGVQAQQCVFVDDLDKNIAVAEAAGMAGVLHRDAATSIPRIAALLDLDVGVLQRA